MSALISTLGRKSSPLERAARFREQREGTRPYFPLDLIKVQFNYNCNNANSQKWAHLDIIAFESDPKRVANNVVNAAATQFVVSVLLQQNIR